MKFEEFQRSVADTDRPPLDSVPLTALWYDAKGEWARAHDLVDELETKEGMAVHAYLHRKHGDISNSEYWYDRAGRQFRRECLEDEWQTLVAEFLK